MKKRILIIEDQEQFRDLYKRYFNAIGSSVFEIIETSNATDATRYLIRYPVDIVILDVEMPGIDGRVMYDVIREYNPDLKVIVASVYSIEKQKKLIPYAMGYYDKTQGLMKLLEMVSQTLVTV